MENSLCLGSIVINKNGPPLIIAEIGINHGGNLFIAKEMVDAAKRAGCRCVKHQTHIVDDEMSPVAKNVLPGNADVSIYEVMDSCALGEDDEYELMRYVQRQGMLFLSTPFSRAAADRLHRFGVEAYKIGSGECNNLPLLKHIAGFGKPMIVSTGMNSLDSVRATVALLDAAGVDYALLHTTNLYPTPPHLVRLGAMTALMEAFPNVLVGLSDHTLNNNACLAATALGASILERHFTDRMDRQGPDISCSMDEMQLRELLAASAEIASMRGGSKVPAPEEQVTIDFAFATVVAIKDVAPGDILSGDNIWVKRPGTGGISASEYESLLGCRARCAIPSGTHLDRAMIEYTGAR